MLVQGHNNFKSNHSVDDNKPSQGKDGVLLQKSPDYPNDGHKFRNGKEAVVSKGDEKYLQSKSKLPENGFKPKSSYDDVSLQRGSHGNPLPGREEHTSTRSDRGYWKEGSMLKPVGCSSQDKRVQQFEDGSHVHDSWGNATRVRESQDAATSRKSPSHAGFHSKSNVNEPFAVNRGGLPDVDNSQRKVEKNETPRAKPYYNNGIPPPYVKPNSKLKNNTQGTKLVSSHVDNDGIPSYPPTTHQKPDAASTAERIQVGLDNSEQDLQATRHARMSKQGYEKELHVHQDAEEVSVLKQKSMRRKHSKSQSTHNDAGNEDVEAVRKSRSRRREETKRGLQILFDDERQKTDEEERIIDRLLIHYSKKPSNSVPEKSRRRSRSRHAHPYVHGRETGPDETPEMAPRPPRSVSLPHEQTEAVEVNKVYARAASFQSDRSKEARHVHPKLPDYDDLAAKLAALRGT